MSNIEWTEKTWNPIAGCTPVSPGCLNCYAATMAHRCEAMAQEKYNGLTVLRNGVRTFNGKINFDEEALTIPLHRKKPTIYFVNSMSDLFHEGVPFDFVDKVFAVMALCPQHTFQVLTKRPERMAEYVSNFYPEGGRLEALLGRMQTSDNSPFDYATADDEKRLSEIDVLPNVWLGTSVENQKCADERIPHLLRCPAAVRFLSCEPLLGEIKLPLVCQICGGRQYVGGGCNYETGDEDPGQPCECTGGGMHAPEPLIDWVIVGGESGAKARPCNVEWIRSIVRQCKEAGVACFVKQLGAKPMDECPTGGVHRLHCDDKKGGDPAEWSEDLRLREMPALAKHEKDSK